MKLPSTINMKYISALVGNQSEKEDYEFKTRVRPPPEKRGSLGMILTASGGGAPVLESTKSTSSLP